MKKHTHTALLFILSLSVVLLQPLASLGASGVGVDTGRIVVEEVLLPGITYTLPSINVINTGDEKGEFSMSTEFNDREDKLKPQKDWFIFTPQRFELQPNAQQKVEIKLTVPSSGVAPGDYAVFVIAQPSKGDDTIGVAAATKLYFSIEGTNLFQTTYYTLRQIYSDYLPWSAAILFFPPLLLALYLLRKKITIEKVEKVKKEEKSPEKE